MLIRLHSRRCCLFLFLFLGMSLQSLTAAQTGGLGLGGAAKHRKKSPSSQTPPVYANAPKPELLNADSNPTLRYPVCVMEEGSSGSSPGAKFLVPAARSSTVSCGWLDVTRTDASYTVVTSAGGGNSKPFHMFGEEFAASDGGGQWARQLQGGGGEGFEVDVNSLRGAQLEKDVLVFDASQMRIYLTYLSQDLWGRVGNRNALFELAQYNMAGTMVIQRAVQNFDSALAEVRPPAAPLDVTLHADPMTVEKGHTVNLTWTSSNATSLVLEPGVGSVALAGGMSVLPQDNTNYTLTATGPGGTKAASVYVTVNALAAAVPPTMVLTEPSVGDGQTVEVSTTPLTIRGVVMDASGIPVITVNGRPVTMRPTSAQAAQFASDPLELQPGDNRFEVAAMNSAHGQAKLTFTAHLTSSPPKVQPPPTDNSKALGKMEIIGLLQGDVPSSRVAGLVRERGIKFSPTEQDLKDIRNAGGGDDLIDTIVQVQSSPHN